MPKKLPDICKKCVYANPHYGNKDKQGKASVSRYWCSAKNGTIKTNPKECQHRKEKNWHDSTRAR